MEFGVNFSFLGSFRGNCVFVFLWVFLGLGFFMCSEFRNRFWDLKLWRYRFVFMVFWRCRVRYVVVCCGGDFVFFFGRRNEEWFGLGVVNSFFFW